MLMIDGEFIMTPRILFNDKNLSKTDIDVLSLIISLALKDGYCHAKNKYLIQYIKVSERTITYSLSKLKKLEYIYEKYVYRERRLYLNKEKIPLKTSSNVAKNCDTKIEENCDSNNNINKEYKREYKKKKEIVPIWMEHPEMCKSEECSPEELAELEAMLSKFK